MKNNFNSGVIKIDGVERNSGSSVGKFIGETIALEAIDQDDDQGYYRIWNTSGMNNSKWKLNDVPIVGARYRNYTHTVHNDDNRSTITADLKKLCNVTFENNFTSVGNGGTIKVNGIQYSSPTSQFQVVEGNTITAEAEYYYHLNGINYTFLNWSDGSTSLSHAFSISQHEAIKANYRGKPTNNGEYIHFGTQVGQPIVIYWTDNPNANVTQYQIWRKVKHNGVMGSEQLIATVSRGTGQYTDRDYVLTSGYTDDIIYYDVRGYYSVEGTYSDPDYVSVYGAEPLYKSGLSGKPTEYSIGAYPNPFNPATTIKYQLPERGHVTIKLYDVTGKEVKELVNEIRDSGYYEVELNGRDLSSGDYICTIKANKYNKSIKLMMVK